MAAKPFKKLNISLEPGVASVLTTLAHQKHLPMSRVIEQLILDSLERREDMALSKIAALRDTEKSKLVTHDKAWN